MKVKDILEKMENGACHVLLFSSQDGLIFLKTIWYNEIPFSLLDCEVDSIEIRDYEMRIGVHQ